MESSKVRIILAIVVVLGLIIMFINSSKDNLAGEAYRQLVSNDNEKEEDVVSDYEEEFIKEMEKEQERLMQEIIETRISDRDLVCLGEYVSEWNGESLNDEYCETDLEVLQIIIDNNSNYGGSILEFGDQEWQEGSLIILNLQNYQLDGVIPPEIGNLNNLMQLRFYENQLSGEIPVEIGNLNNLRNLYFHDNELGGVIPVEIGNLTNLRYLSLSNNDLGGVIPVEIGNLINLQYLDLENNHLTGCIPEYICNIQSAFIQSNEFCPYYPDCIDIGYQNCQSEDYICSTGFEYGCVNVPSSCLEYTDSPYWCQECCLDGYAQQASNYNENASIFDGSCDYGNTQDICSPYTLYMVIDITGSMQTDGIVKAHEIIEHYSNYDLICGLGIIAFEVLDTECETNILSIEEALELTSHSQSVDDFLGACSEYDVSDRTRGSPMLHLYSAYEHLLTDSLVNENSECDDSQKIIYLFTDDNGITGSGDMDRYTTEHMQHGAGRYEIEPTASVCYGETEYPCTEENIVQFRQELIDDDIKVYFSMREGTSTISWITNFDFRSIEFHFGPHPNFIYNEPIPETNIEEECVLICDDPDASNYGEEEECEYACPSSMIHCYGGEADDEIIKCCPYTLINDLETCGDPYFVWTGCYGPSCLGIGEFTDPDEDGCFDSWEYPEEGPWNHGWSDNRCTDPEAVNCDCYCSQCFEDPNNSNCEGNSMLCYDDVSQCAYEGCTDPDANNYDPDANYPCYWFTQPELPTNVCCEYDELPGCTDPEASNYDEDANIDDGSCEYVYGCVEGEPCLWLEELSNVEQGQFKAKLYVNTEDEEIMGVQTAVDKNIISFNINEALQGWTGFFGEDNSIVAYDADSTYSSGILYVGEVTVSMSYESELCLILEPSSVPDSNGNNILSNIGSCLSWSNPGKPEDPIVEGGTVFDNVKNWFLKLF